MEKDFDIKPYFFAHNAENSDEFRNVLMKSYDDFVAWRNSFHPEDLVINSGVNEDSAEYIEGKNRFNKYYDEMLDRLHSSIPFHSPRYLGHMQSERFMPGVLGYFASLLYNLNNVSFEGSPVTIEMECEIAKDLAKMIGYDTNLSWGHLTGGGTVANIEALWVVRNTKYFPLIAQDLAKKYNKDFKVTLANKDSKMLCELDEYSLLTISPTSISDLVIDFFDEKWDCNIYEEVFVNKKNISHVGMGDFYNGKILISATKHYSWPKAAEILGFGRQNTVLVDVDNSLRMDIENLKEKLVECSQKRQPVVAVIAMAGTTEASAVDSIDKIQEVRSWFEREYNSSFFIHVDAAYGGYVKSLFLDKNDKIKSYDDVKDYMGGCWPSKEVYNAYCAIDCADSVTVDPHKLGYLPYPAGAVIYKNKITKPSTIAHAPYISSATKPENEDLYFGEYILEGSKSGSGAAACWLAHKIIPINDFGYGKFLKNEIIDASYIISEFKKQFPLTLKNGKSVNIEFFNKIPDIDVLLYAFNLDGETDIDKFNEFNDKILNKMCFHTDKPINEHNYMVVSTKFDYSTYKNSINKSLENLGLDVSKWIEGKTPVELFRTTVMNVNVYSEELKSYYYKGFVNAFVQTIEEILN